MKNLFTLSLLSLLLAAPSAFAEKSIAEQKTDTKAVESIAGGILGFALANIHNNFFYSARTVMNRLAQVNINTSLRKQPKLLLAQATFHAASYFACNKLRQHLIKDSQEADKSSQLTHKLTATAMFIQLLTAI